MILRSLGWGPAKNASECKGTCVCVHDGAHILREYTTLFFLPPRSDVNRFPRVSLVVVFFVWLPSTRTRTRQGPVQILVEPFILPATCQRGYSALNTIVCLPNTSTHAHLRSVGVEGLSSGSIPATKTHRTSQNMRIHGECIQKGRERRAVVWDWSAVSP